MLAAQRGRDARDREREHGALRAADDAVEIDTTGLEPRRGRRPGRRPRPRTGPREPPEPPVSADRRHRRLPQRRQVARWSTAWSAAARRSTAAEPGVTRDRKRLATEWNGVALRPDRHRRHRPRGRGRAGPRHPGAGAARRSPRPTRSLLVVDGRAGLRAGDAELARTLRGAEVPVLVVVNKADRPNDYAATAEFHALGLGEPLAVSATPRPRHRRPARRDRRRARRAAPATTRRTTRSGSRSSAARTSASPRWSTPSSAPTG